MAMEFSGVIGEATVIAIITKSELSKVGKKKAAEQLMAKFKEQGQEWDKANLHELMHPVLLEQCTHLILGLQAG